jgi:uncharacterized protein involved in exopolysaccharide biosynthesis
VSIRRGVGAAVVLTLAICVLGAPALAAETITYSYDARGRVKQVARSGSVNNGVQTSYQYDKANNRKNTTTTGSSNPPPP